MILIYILLPVKGGSNIKHRIRLCASQCLILSFFLAGCFSRVGTSGEISVEWTDSVATALVVPRHLVPSSSDSIRDFLFVRLAAADTGQAILGEYVVSADEIVFEPLSPFTRDLTYEVEWKGEVLDRIHIPPAADARTPSVISVYPSADSLPENLLKIYIHFSQPMMEANPLAYLRLLRNGTDTIRDVFLDLRPALWNRKGTVLTMWLDPGRIKRDLQPNEKLGPPLKEGESYSLMIDAGWPSKEGKQLRKPYAKKFFATHRDEVSPDPRLWRISTPKAGSTDPLRVQLKEALDALLLTEAVSVMSEHGENISGEYSTSNEETMLSFVPDAAWRPGSYQILCEPRLEDLAGNNLDRLFDVDLTKQSKGGENDVYRIPFTIEN